MPVLVSSVATTLASRCGAWTAAANLDANAPNDAISTSARELGLTLADPLNVVDADLAAVTQDQVSQLVDVAELRLLESTLENYASVDQKISLGSISFGQLRADLERAVARKVLYVEQRYGIGRGTLTGGTVNLRFQQELCNWPDDCAPPGDCP